MTTEIDCEVDTCAHPVQLFRPIEIVVPTEYNNPSYKHDIALIKLDRDVKYTSMDLCLVFNGNILNV